MSTTTVLQYSNIQYLYLISDLFHLIKTLIILGLVKNNNRLEMYRKRKIPIFNIQYNFLCKFIYKIWNIYFFKNWLFSCAFCDIDANSYLIPNLSNQQLNYRNSWKITNSLITNYYYASCQEFVLVLLVWISQIVVFRCSRCQTRQDEKDANYSEGLNWFEALFRSNSPAPKGLPTQYGANFQSAPLIDDTINNSWRVH